MLGFGVVGSGVIRALQDKIGLIEKRTGIRLKLLKVADLDLERDRGVSVPAGILTRDAASVVNDSDVDIVIELIGGVRAARDLIEMSLKLGKPVVTANKALLAEHGDEIFKLAESNGTDVYFEASVGGGMPLIHALRESMVSNHIRSIYGILNGTCNYILTRMEQYGLSFDEALGEARAAGFAEADPSLDIDGVDTAHKAAILASLVYGFHAPMRQLHVEGIRNLSSDDISNVSDLGYRVKMLAVIKDVNGEVEIRTHPTLIPKESVMASVGGVFNAVLMNGDGVGDVLWYGRGAGRDPTASSILADIVDAARNIVFENPRRAPGFVAYNPDCRIMDMGEARVRCYLRLTLLDKPGVFGQIASVLGRHGISIASLLQKETRVGEQVPVIVITHHACEKEFVSAIKEMDEMPVVGAETVRLRIEDC